VGIGNAPVNLIGSLIGTNASPIDPRLAPLADNGGPTPTHAPLPGSPASNAGDPTLVAGTGDTPLFDQRGPGFPRIADGRIDLGSIDLNSPNNTFPVFTSPTAVSVAENSIAVQTVTAADPEVPPQILTYSIRSGPDAAKFAITPGGVLTFKEGQDYEIPGDADGNRTYLVDVQVEDGAGGIVFQTITVTITPANEYSPVFTSPSVASVIENTLPVMPVVAKDADLPAQTITFSIAGGPDGDRFIVTPTGTLLCAEAPDFEEPTDANGDNLYEVTVQASDGAGGTTTQAISVTVTSSVPPPPVNADFNGDGFVTAADLAIWRQNFGTTGGPAPTLGDADHDRDVDGADFLIWQRTLGQVPPPAAPAVVAAEATKQESDASPDAVSFYLDSDVLLAPPSDPRSDRLGDQPRRRPRFRPTVLSPANAAPAETRTSALASPAAVDAAIAVSGPLAIASAFDALLFDSGPLDDLFPAAPEF
jgi:hypothetical protein